MAKHRHRAIANVAPFAIYPGKAVVVSERCKCGLRRTVVGCTNTVKKGKWRQPKHGFMGETP
jgi:hypothetical protein